MLAEQGMQMAVLRRSGPVRVVGVDEVSICSPFPPHLPGLGRCGAHFVGLNARELPPWKLDGRPASELTSAHFARTSLPSGSAPGCWDAPQWTEGGAAAG